MTTLDPFTLDTEPDLDTDEQRERYTIGGDREASWALRKMWKAQREVTRLKANHAEAVAALDDQLARALGGPERDVRFFDGLLGEYHRTLIDRGEADKTYRLPAGELTARKAPDTLEVLDADALRDYAEGTERLDLVRIKVEPDKRAILAAVKETGETIPGVVIRRGETRYAAAPYDIGLVDG